MDDGVNYTAGLEYVRTSPDHGTAYDIEFVAGAQSNPLVMVELEVTEGEWTITRGKNGGTQDIFFPEHIRQRYKLWNHSFCM